MAKRRVGKKRTKLNTMKYNNFRLRPITIREANIVLELLKSYKIDIIYLGRHDNYKEVRFNHPDFNYSKYAIVKENDTSLWIETKYYEPKYRATRYICWLDDEMRPAISGLQCFNELQRWCFKAINAKNYHNADIDRLYDETTGRYVCSAGPLIGFNPRYEKQELHDVYEYDINSAYSAVMLDHIPNVNKPYFNQIIKKGQVGFILDEKCTMLTVPGCFAQVVFDLIELKPDQKKYINNLYNRKRLAVDELDKNTIKTQLNASIGYYQRYNPFIRAYIVHTCNNHIKALLDSDSVLWNTDAIFSLKRRPELELGTDIGQFKEKYIKRFAYIGNNYQIDYDIPKYRGIPKCWFIGKYDILKDTLPERCNKFVFNQTKSKLIANEVYYEKINESAKSSQ